MKIKSNRRRNGFTLVELLVVITIIAVLAGAGFAAGNAAIQKAKKTTALATCIAIESAVNNFYTEYGSMPSEITDDNPSPLQTNSPDGLKLVKVLLGTDDAASLLLNPRQIKFLSVKEGKGKKGGLIYDKTGVNIDGLFDPWGGPFNVVLDGNYDEKVKVKPTGSSSDVTLNGRRAGVWSEGADGVEKSSKSKTTDDVKTW